MDTIRRFFSYVEIKTKITSIFPFFMTLAYLFLTGRAIRPLPTAVFFGGMLFFDLTATTINNYSDTRKNHQTLPFSRRAARSVTLALMALSVLFGLYLVCLTDLVVLALGALCFFFGVFYSFGPAPISHGPYGEAVSGFFYGALIPFIVVYINAPDSLLTYSLTGEALAVRIALVPAAGFGLLAAAPFCLTAAVMLANNICDLPRDVAVHRYTLAFYLKRRALHLFAGLYAAVYASVAAMVLFRFLPPLSLLVFLTVIPAARNIRLFYKRQVKEETFAVSIKNFVLILSAHTVLMFLGGFLPGWGPG